MQPRSSPTKWQILWCHSFSFYQSQQTFCGCILFPSNTNTEDKKMSLLLTLPTAILFIKSKEIRKSKNDHILIIVMYINDNLFRLARATDGFTTTRSIATESFWSIHKSKACKHDTSYANFVYIKALNLQNRSLSFTAECKVTTNKMRKKLHCSNLCDHNYNCYKALVLVMVFLTR